MYIGLILANGLLELGYSNLNDASLRLTAIEWPAFCLDGLRPGLRVDGEDLTCVAVERNGDAAIAYRFSKSMLLCARFDKAGELGLRVSFSLTNESGAPAVLNRVVLFETQAEGEGARFGADSGAVRVLEQGNYWGRVVPLEGVGKGAAGSGTGEPVGTAASARHASDLLCVVRDRGAGKALLVGFETSERWLGQFEIASRNAEPGQTFRAGFDGGDTLLDAGETAVLEDLVFLAGDDPLQLLADYGDLVRARHAPRFPAAPPVSWCSWYPYRLGVTEERILETARIAAERLKPLGLGIIEVDLGWERECLPNAFEENENFPHGLAWLADRLGELGFDLGVWKAPFTISEFHPLALEHPEWLVQDAAGKPAPYWTWFWQPHGNVFILDLTHPGAQEWVRQNVADLYARGVRYFKADFIGCVSHELAKRRYDRHIVAGGGTEAARIGARIVREAMPEALQLNCGGPEMPGTGHWPLLYTCNDTGNTGFITAAQQKDNYQAVACHLFKNGRWGVIQPSCLCVGLPGTLEDARLRATAAFLAGGQIDISDTLTTLPEDRWRVLCATLPPLGITARPVDLFDPIFGPAAYDYEATCKEGGGVAPAPTEYPPGSVWHVRAAADWDTWDLAGIFCYEGAAPEAARLSRYQIPFATLGLDASAKYWAFEFWSGQFLGEVPVARTNSGGYAHPGDLQDFVVGNTPGCLDVAFFGPGVKLLCLRAARPHPWVAGTTFHQSCGAELQSVAWDPAAAALTGELQRPPGESGAIIVATAGRRAVACEIDGQPAPLRPGANGCLVLQVAVRQTPVSWRVLFEPQ